MSSAFFIFLGGGVGALARWGVGLVVLRWLGAGWPWGTLCVNVVGGFAMGLVTATALRQGWPDEARVFATVGVLGGFTTFSAFSLETARLIEAGRTGEAALYALVSVVASVAALFAGLALGRGAG
jgi:fluoride exporter